MEFFEGTLNGVEVVIVRSGIGKVNAGICTQILADLFDVTHIINTGIAGEEQLCALVNNACQLRHVHAVRFQLSNRDVMSDVRAKFP